jgi:predicted Zn finger-like uncharacterized protein
MILQCPACNARYAVPDHAIGVNGRVVKCVKCAHQWHVAGVQPTVENLEALLAPPEPPVAKPIAKGANVPAPAGPITTPMLISTLAACFLLAIVTTLFTSKPGLFGYGKTENVTFTDLALQKQEVEKGREYAISGKLLNTSKEDIKPPTVRITLVDKEGAALQFWEPQMPEKIAANDALTFNFGPLTTRFTSGDRLVIEMGNALELALRGKP